MKSDPVIEYVKKSPAKDPKPFKAAEERKFSESPRTVFCVPSTPKTPMLERLQDAMFDKVVEKLPEEEKEAATKKKKNKKNRKR